MDIKKKEHANNDSESIFALTILEKIKQMRLTFSQGSVTVWKKIQNYQEARVKLTDTQLSTLKSVAKNKTGKIWRLSKKHFVVAELPH